MNYKGCIPEVVAVPSEGKAFELEEFKASWYLGPKPDTFIFSFWGLCYKPSHFNGWESNKLLLSPPLYEGYWFRTQSLLFGNPTNPSMAVLGPRWLYEAEH